MKATHSKGKVTYRYKGDLESEIHKCEKELDKLLSSPESKFIEWQYEQAKKKYDSHLQRISDLKSFIRLASKKLTEGEE